MGDGGGKNKNHTVKAADLQRLTSILGQRLRLDQTHAPLPMNLYCYPPPPK